jgi:hypothetical protein
MGLSMSTSRKSWSHSYTTFGHVRRVLGDLSGVRVDEVSEHFDKGLMGFWSPSDEVSDPMVFLQSHYDTEGILMPYTAAVLAERIRNLLSESDVEKPDRDLIIEMVEVFEDAAENYEVVMFT